MKQVWQTQDGSVFQSELEATNYETVLKERKELEAKLSKYRDIVDELIDILLDNGSYEREDFGCQIIFNPESVLEAAKFLMRETICR